MIIDQPVTMSDRPWLNVPLVTIFKYQIIMCNLTLVQIVVLVSLMNVTAITEREFGLSVQVINSGIYSVSLQ